MSYRWINKKLIIRAISLIIVLIYIVFLYMDAAGKDLGSVVSLYLKYSTILLCFILSLFIGSDGHNKKDTILVLSARFFTVIADYFLVIQSDFNLGILCFCIVQISYIIRHSFFAKINLYKVFLLAFLFIAALLVMLSKIEMADMSKITLLEAACYGCLLLCSLYCAFMTKKPFIAVGMLLFFLCDMNVALYNVSNIFCIGFLMWMFYLPSQLLLALSGFKEDYLKEVFKG